jgi:hypothetical protein
LMPSGLKDMWLQVPKIVNICMTQFFLHVSWPINNPWNAKCIASTVKYCFSKLCYPWDCVHIYVWISGDIGGLVLNQYQPSQVTIQISPHTFNNYLNLYLSRME